MGVHSKFILILMVLITTVICIARENYQVVLLGDLHYDSEDIRINTDKLKSYQKREMQRNVALWKKNIPALLKAAADYANKNDVQFSIQCGDITQGDEGKYEFAVTSFKRVLQYVNQEHTKPVYVVRGNHDCRGKGKLKACADVLWEYMKKQDVIFPLPQKSQTCYKIVGKDLFIFFDSMRINLKAVKLSLQAKTDARHIFFVTHIPVMPGGLDFICSDTQYGEKIRTLLAKHNVIVLAAHRHETSYFDWEMPEGSIKQFLSFSMVKDSTIASQIVNYSGSEYLKRFEKKVYPARKEKKHLAMQNFLNNFIGKLNHCIQYKSVAGFNVLRIEGDKVFVDMYSGKLDKVVFSRQIK